MKKIILTLVAALCSTLLFSQNYSEIKASQLPKGATTYVTTNFKGMPIKKAVKIDDNGVIKYGAVLEGNGRKYTLVFDKNGKFLDKGESLFGKKQNKNAKDPSKTNTTKSTGQSSETAIPKK